MEDYLSLLNEEQNKAVTTSSQYVRVVAGAGSGKTRVLTTRIVYLIKQWGIAPESILAITFTNKAANEMKKRIVNMLGGTTLGSHISTIHSFCVSVLRQEIGREHYPNNFTILDGDDQKAIIKEGASYLGYKLQSHDIKEVINYIGNNKGAGFSPEAALQKALSDEETKKAKLYEYYQERCHQLYGLDFDDLLIWTNRIFEKYDKAREKWQKRFNFILVDEFQDIDEVQMRLIDLLTTENTYLYVVGDPDQTIYSWRGANINIIMGFEKKHPNSETIVLSRNYRSTKMILQGANSLIKYNKNRIAKDLYTNNEEGEKILHYTADNDMQEAQFVASKINSLSKKNVKYRNIAVLYRSSYLSRALEKRFMDFHIPYVIYGGIRFFERKEVKDILSYLRMIIVGDDLSFKRTINEPKRGIGDATIKSLFDLSVQNKKSLFDSITDYQGNTKAKKELDKYHAMILSWREREKTSDLEATFQMVYEESGYRALLENSQEEGASERIENLKELLNDIIDFASTNENTALEDYLNNVALYTDLQRDNESDYVSMMTVHAAKGLEFDYVFVIGLSEGVFPSQITTRESGLKGLEEERRLAYVAFTRAKKQLVLTDNTGFSFSTTTAKYHSRFIDEIDKEYINTLLPSSAKTVNTSSIGSSNYTNKATKSTTSYRPGDKVYHRSFGEGLIISLVPDKNLATIAFAYPFMTKKISLDYVSKEPIKNE